MAPRKTITKKVTPSKPRKPSKPAKLARLAKTLIERKAAMPLKGRNAVFTGKVFVISGEFKDSHENMEKWIIRHGGRVDKVVTDDTTHLVCSMQNFKDKVTHGESIVAASNYKAITDKF
jgi:NAD-dependent DNA ligase